MYSRVSRNFSLRIVLYLFILCTQYTYGAHTRVRSGVFWVLKVSCVRCDTVYIYSPVQIERVLLRHTACPVTASTKELGVKKVFANIEISPTRLFRFPFALLVNSKGKLFVSRCIHVLSKMLTVPKRIAFNILEEPRQTWSVIKIISIQRNSPGPERTIHDGKIFEYKLLFENRNPSTAVNNPATVFDYL